MEKYMSFANLKRNGTNLSKLVEAAANAGGNGQQNNSKDERFWYPSRDKAGNGYAVIRFLPGKGDLGTPWARYWDHAFKGPTGQWYIEKSLTSIGQQDALAEANSVLWNSGIESDKTIVRQRKRNLRYVANALIINDSTNPENNGQVRLFRFGKKIFDKIMDAMQPKYPDETPMNPFDLWEGGEFTIKVRMVEGYPNYDNSSFKSPSALFEGDEAKLEAIYEKQYDLGEWTDPANYKSYDELKARLNLVLGEAAPRTVQQRVDLDTRAEPAPMKTAEAASIDEDDTMSYFAKLAADD
jgi:hypothetical protein